jgi:hypothetical protein
MPTKTDDKDSGGFRTLTRDGCNNGCCDYDWMYNSFDECQGGATWSWFLFNRTWSVVDSGGDVYGDNMFACSASGTSHWIVDVGDGSGGEWDITQAHWRKFWWWSPCNWPFCTGDEWVVSGLNWSSNPHLSTHCGLFYF